MNYKQYFKVSRICIVIAFMHLSTIFLNTRILAHSLDAIIMFILSSMLALECDISYNHFKNEAT